MTDVDAKEAKAFLISYLEAVKQKDWEFVIPSQDKASRLVVLLCDSPRFPRLQGNHFHSQNITHQLQTVQTALANLEDDPSRLDDPDTEEADSSPWAAASEELRELADTMPETGWTAQATEAAQLVRYVSPDTAAHIDKVVSQYNFFGQQEMPTARRDVIGAIKGAARGARLLGAVPHSDTPNTQVTVSQHQTQSTTSVTVTTITELLKWEDLPDEVRPALMGMEAATQTEDKPGFMKAASDFAERASKFPQLIDKIGDAWDWVSTLGVF